LSPERRRVFEQWLFVERVSYPEAASRAEREWGIKGSVSSVGNYCRRTLEIRGMEEAVGLRDTAQVVKDADVDPGLMQAATLKMVGKRFLERALEDGDIEELSALGRLMHEAEGRELNRKRLALELKRMELDVWKAARRMGDADLAHETEQNDDNEQAKAG